MLGLGFGDLGDHVVDTLLELLVSGGGVHQRASSEIMTCRLADNVFSFPAAVALALGW